MSTAGRKPFGDNNGSSNDVRALMASCQGLVRSIAWKIHRRVPRQVELDDLISYGQVGLAEAARDFDASRGHQFTTFAYYRIRGAIFDGLSTMSWFNQADYSRGRYSTMADNVLGDDPEAESSSTEGDSSWFRNTSRALAVVYMFCNSQAGEGGEPLSIASQEDAPDAGIAREELRNVLKEAVESLEGDARHLIQSVYFDGLNLKEAGERINISKAWASRLHARALQQLAKIIGERQMA